MQMAQVALGLDRRGAARTSSGDGLPINAIRHITRDENARMFALRQMPDEQISVRIGLEFSFERLRVRIVTDRDKNAGDLENRSSCVCTLRNFTADISPFSSGMYFVTTVFQIGSIFSHASTRSAMILEARSLSRRWMR